jgi:hypothetical protein
MKAHHVHSALLLLSTLMLGVSAATRKYDLKIERKDISPDGEAHFYGPSPLSDQLTRLYKKRIGNQRTDSRT